MSKLLLKEFACPAIGVGETYIVSYNGLKLSESSLKDHLPALGIDILNKSAEEIKVFVNDTNDSAMRLPANSSRQMVGYPAHEIAIMNLGTAAITAGSVVVTILNDLEQISRYAAYIKRW
jgi:hypothetical protein